jgi:hypothetical protein
MNKVEYSSYTSGFKLKLVEYAEKDCNGAAGREFTLLEFNERYWREQKDALLQTTNKSRKAFRGPKSGNFPEIEDEILKYVRGLRSNGVGVSREMLHFKAREIATRQIISFSQFKVSRGWMCRFMKREGLSLRRRASLSERVQKDFDDKIIAFHKAVIGLRKNNTCLISQIGNADQTLCTSICRQTRQSKEKGEIS